MPSINLKAKFAVLTGAMILAVATIITAFLTHQQERTIRNELLRQGVSLSENLAYNCQLPLVTENTTSLRRLALGLLKAGEVGYVQFQNQAGEVLVRVGEVESDSLRILHLPDAREYAEEVWAAWLATPAGREFLAVRVPVTLAAASEGDILSSNQPANDDELLGHVQVGMSTLGVEQRIASMRALANLLGVVIALAGSLIAAALIHVLTRPLAQLMEGNRRVANADFSLRLKVRSRDEFGQLASSYNQMADEIQRSRELAEKYLESLRKNAEDLEEANRALQLNNAEIAKVSRMKSEFLAVMSHELRTPLNGIIGFSEVLLDEKFGNLNAKQKRFAENTLSSGRHLLALINDILDLSKVEAGKTHVDATPFDLRQSLDEIQTLVRSLALKKGIELHCHEAPPAVLMTDPKLFRQVMFNLLSNAIKFTQSGGRVDVRARCLSAKSLRTEPISRAIPSDGREQIPERELLLVEVRDTGVGIAPEDYDKIFVAFQQVDRTYSRDQEGTGLGLALTRRIVRLLGGEVWFVSHEGEGSLFAFYIPAEFDGEEREDDSLDLLEEAEWMETSRKIRERSERFRAESRREEMLDDKRMGAEAVWPWGEPGDPKIALEETAPEMETVSVQTRKGSS